MSLRLTLLVLLCYAPPTLDAQDYGARLGTVKRGGKVSFEPRGPGVLFDALDPAVRKWYIPQELYTEYRWKQWEYSNYARDFYQRYVSTSLEGSYIYDVYGNYLTRGWLVFDWRQQNPQPFGSTLAQKGSLTSEPKDFSLVTRWGRLDWEGESPNGTSVSFESRAGNS